MPAWNFSRWSVLPLLLALGAYEPVAVAQSEIPAPTPYASMDTRNVDYRGPGREKRNDLQPHSVRIGLLLPMRGPRAGEGRMLSQAAQISIDAENRTRPLPNGQQFSLAVDDETGPWGQASSAMVRLIMQDEVIALITSTDGSIAHQAEQIANKVGLPILTLASDPTTTQINIPWIFRIAPSDIDQARAMAAEIYGVHAWHKVLLITESGHDGRIGGEEFLKVAASLHQEPPARLLADPETYSSSTLEQVTAAHTVEAVVLWTSAAVAEKLLPDVQRLMPSTPIFLCQKASDFLPGTASTVGSEGTRQILTVGSGSDEGEFAQRYRNETGRLPGLAAEQINVAIRTLTDAVRLAGTANRARVRNCLAASSHVTADGISFDPAGNSLKKLNLVSVQFEPNNEIPKASH